MAYLAIAYPDLEAADFEWIQDYRQKYDSRYFSVVDPHITLVFAIHNIEQGAFVNEVTQRLQGVKAFDFTIKVTTINQDDSGDYYHEFLVPDEGYSDIVKMHDKLYAGLFADHLRYDIDFIPHIGIGNSENVADSKSRVDKLNSQDLMIKGRVSAVDIVEYKDGVVKTLQKIQLQN
jgi:2'-5' RNA ligase